MTSETPQMKNSLRESFFLIFLFFGSVACFGQCTVALSSPLATSSQTVCVNTQITPITYLTSNATGANFSNLPIGVTGVWQNGVVTISGTVSTPGSNTFAVNLVGCNGGVSSAGGTIIVVAAPIAGTLSGDQTICAGLTTSFSSNGFSGGTWSSSNTAVASVSVSGVVTGVAAGSATITYTVTGTGGCSNATATLTVSVAAAPNSGALSGTQAICVGGTTTFSSNGNTGGSWTSNATGVATVNASSGAIAGLAPGSATITYTVLGTGGCSNATATRTVTVTAAPNAGTLSGTQEICVGSSTTFSSNGNAVGSWTSSATGVAIVNFTTGVITGVAAGTATITYTVTGTGGCSNATATRTVTVTAPPNAGALSGTQAICVGGTTTFSSNGNAVGNWTSNSTAIATVNASSGAISAVAAGTANITYTVTGTGGCSNATATRTITVDPISESDIINSSQSTVCSALSPFANAVTLYASAASVGVKTWQYSLDNATFTDFSNSNLQNYVLNNLVTDVGSEHIPVTKYYRLKTVSGVCPADHSAVIPILIKPRPKSNNRNYTICSGEIFGFTPTDDANTIIPDNTILDYVAAGQGNMTGFSSQSNQSIINAELVNLDYVNNSVVYSVIPSYQECEGSQFQIEVNVMRHPEIIASDDESICEGESIQLYSVDLFNAPGTYFDWTNGDVQSLNFPYISNPIAQPETTNQYIVSMRDPINTLCYGSDTVSVTVNSKPYFEITGPTGNICTGNTYIFQTVEETNLDQLVWTSSNAEIVTTEMNQLVAHINEPGEIGISALATSEEGCTYSSQIFVESGETPSPEIQGSTQLCLNNETTEYYTISPDNGFQWQITNGVLTSGNGTPGIGVSWNQSGMGQLVLSETEWQSGCTASDTLDVYLSEAPFFTLHPTNAIICSGSDFTIDIQSDEEYQFEWTIQNANLISTSPLQATINSVNPGSVILSGTAHNLEGCSYSNFVELNVGATPSVDISGPSIVCANSVYQQYEGSSQFGNGLTWTIENGAVTNGQGTTDAEVSWFVGNEGTIILTAHEWQSGCEASDSLVVSFEGEAPGIFEVEMLGQNSTVLLCSNSSFPFYRWGYTLASTGVENTFNSNASYFEYNQIDNINYYYWVEYGAVNGCMTRSYYNTPPILTAIQNEDSATDNDFIVYPNPVNDVLNISSKNWTHNAKVEVLTSTGTMLDSRLHSGYSMPLDLSKYSGGIYLVKLTTANSIQVFPIVKR